MSLESLKTPSRPIDVPRDKPQVDRVEHANLDRPGAVMHPRAGSDRGWTAQAPRAGWARHLASPSWR
jgi:hypothetical protein